jgi:hypothetical protein
MTKLEAEYSRALTSTGAVKISDTTDQRNDVVKVGVSEGGVDLIHMGFDRAVYLLKPQLANELLKMEYRLSDILAILEKPRANCQVINGALRGVLAAYPNGIPIAAVNHPVRMHSVGAHMLLVKILNNADLAEALGTLPVYKDPSNE